MNSGKRPASIVVPLDRKFGVPRERTNIVIPPPEGESVLLKVVVAHQQRFISSGVEGQRHFLGVLFN